MTTSSVVDKALRRHVRPALLQHGFERVGPRNAWAWKPTSILVFNIRAVGRYFGDVTGWPPSSVCVWLGAYYPFIPGRGPIKQSEDRRALPAEVACHMRGHLWCRLDQTGRTRHLANPAERGRHDIWWVEPDGSNAEAVAVDVAGALVDEGIPRYEGWSNLSLSLDELEREHDCFTKFFLTYHVAKFLGDADRTRRYRELLIAEGKRIGHVPLL